jgi:tRNA threonylcarbamoyladenosine biosynthesis protein TsaE
VEKRIENLAALETEAADFIRSLTSRDTATLVTLSGELGAGKTTFTQAVARALGVTDPVTSPTFVLEKIYVLPAGRQDFRKLVHIDAYRLKSGSELKPLGFDEVMKDPGTLVLLEWPERVADALPVPAVAITLTPLPDNARTLSYAY